MKIISNLFNFENKSKDLDTKAYTGVGNETCT